MKMMNPYLETVVQALADRYEMDGEMVLVLSDNDLKNLTIKAEPDVEIAFALRGVSLN